MKKYLIILICFFPILLNAQNSEPIQRTFVVPTIEGYESTPVLLSGNWPYFLQDRFIRGNHWDTSPRLDKAVGYNQKDIYNYHFTGVYYSEAEPTELNDNTLLHVKLRKIGGWYNGKPWYINYYTHCQDPDVVNARGIEYAPFLTIDPNVTNKLQTIYYDPGNHVFGFQNINGIIDTNNYCLKLDNTISANTLVLQNPWPNDQLFYLENMYHPSQILLVSITKKIIYVVVCTLQSICEEMIFLRI